MKLRPLGIRFKLIFSFFFLAFLPLVLLGYLLFTNVKNHLLEEAIANHININRILKQQILSQAEFTLGEVSYLAGLPSFETLAEKQLRENFGDSKSDEAFYDILTSHVNPGGLINTYLFLHPETGEVLRSSDHLHNGKFFDKKIGFKEGKVRPSIHPVHYSLTLEKNIFTLTAPIQKGGRVLGILMAWADLGQLQSNIKIVPNVHNYLVSRANLFVYEKYDQSVALPIRPIKSTATERALRMETGGDIYENQDGVMVVGAYSNIEPLGLALLTETPLTIVLAELNHAGLQVFFITFVLAVLILVVSLYIGDRITSPLVRMSLGADRIASGNLHERVDVRSDDEMGQLGKAMNRMAESLSLRDQELSWEIELHSTISDLSKSLLGTRSVKQISYLSLDYALNLTASPHGFAGYINPNTGYLEIPSLTKDIWKQCQVPKDDVVFKELSGLLGWVLKNKRPLITNTAEDDPRSSGVPKGHIAISNLVCVPAMIEGELVGMVAVANSERAYGDHDIVVLERIAGLYALALKRKQDDEELAAEKEQLSVTLRSIGDGVITTDTSGIVVLMNRVAEEITGLTTVGAVGRPIAQVFPVCSVGEKKALNLQIAEQEGTRWSSSQVQRALLLDAAGLQHTVAFNISPILDSKRNLLGSVFVFRDITRQIQIEDELQKAEKLESIGLLAGGIAHDFNNLLTVILGNISMAKIYVEDSSQIAENLAMAEKASMQARGLTKQLLTFAKGGAPIQERVSLPELINDSAGFALRGSSVRLEHVYAGDLWDVYVDRDQVGQVFHNLILNASQAMIKGGVVTITAENSSVAHRELVDLKAGDYVKISIQDQGPGIASGHLEKIFDPFFTTKDAGTGLGLSTSYSIVRNHNGHIQVQSEIGAGALFILYLPALPKEVRTAREPEQEVVFAGGGRVLIMDDEKSIRDSVARMLRRKGYEVELAENGEETLALYGRAADNGERFDVVILDLTVPGAMGGKEAIAELLKMDDGARVIVSSGYSNDPVMAQFSDYGFMAVIVKPYRMEELINTVGKVMAEEKKSQ